MAILFPKYSLEKFLYRKEEEERSRNFGIRNISEQSTGMPSIFSSDLSIWRDGGNNRKTKHPDSGSKNANSRWLAASSISHKEESNEVKSETVEGITAVKVAKLAAAESGVAAKAPVDSTAANEAWRETLLRQWSTCGSPQKASTSSLPFQQRAAAVAPLAPPNGRNSLWLAPPTRPAANRSTTVPDLVMDNLIRSLKTSLILVANGHHPSSVAAPAPAVQAAAATPPGIVRNPLANWSPMYDTAVSLQSSASFRPTPSSSTSSMVSCSSSTTSMNSSPSSSLINTSPGGANKPMALSQWRTGASDTNRHPDCLSQIPVCPVKPVSLFYATSADTSTCRKRPLPKTSHEAGCVPSGQDLHRWISSSSSVVATTANRVEPPVEDDAASSCFSGGQSGPSIVTLDDFDEDDLMENSIANGGGDCGEEEDDEEDMSQWLVVSPTVEDKASLSMWRS